MSALSTAEFERLSLIAAGVDPSQIPSILDTATWRRLLIAGLLKNAANQAISGQVDNYSQLPVTVGAPAIGATYLVKYSTGIFYINYKSAGIYVKVADTGSLTDWVYAPLSAVGTLPDVTLTNPQVGDTITWNGTNWINRPSYIRTIITTTGTSTYNIPPGTKRLKFRLIGGGEGGSAGLGINNNTSLGGRGGNGGALTEIEIDKDFPQTTLSVTVGVGGLGASFGEAPTPGTDTIVTIGGILGSIRAGGGAFVGGVDQSFGMFPGGIGNQVVNAGAGAGGFGGFASRSGGTSSGFSGSFPYAFNTAFQTDVAVAALLPGRGGGGGSGSTSSSGLGGTRGGLYGAGGGGGGGAAPPAGPSTPGSGARGAQGLAVIWAYF